MHFIAPATIEGYFLQ